MELQVTGAEEVRWNLSDLYADERALARDLAAADAEAGAFARRFSGRVARLDEEELLEALRTLERILALVGRAQTYAFLHWSTQTQDPARGALLQKVREEHTQISKQILFFELEWAAVDEERARAQLASPQLAPFRHYLEVQRLLRDHLLSEPEEKILAEKAVTGRAAWTRLFDEMTSAARFQVDGRSLTQQEVLARLYEPDRASRRQAALALTEGLRERQRELTFIFNTILADKASDDRLRGYQTWLSSRNLSNEVADEVVEALIEAVTSRYDLVARFYELKRRLLGLDELYDYDRYAPIGEAPTRYAWTDAEEVVRASYTSFHPLAGEVVGRFFDRRWIDAAVLPGKRSGAFSHSAVPDVHPYILMNFTGRIRDVQTLAHELGHGLHQFLARRQGVLQADTPLTTAETASVFGEMLVFQALMNREDDPSARLAMLVSKIDDSMATVFRQITMNRFEDRIHRERRGAGELSPDTFCELWMETQERMYGGSVVLGEHYRHWWSYIPHFLHTPGYVYAYAFGELLVLALFSRFKAEGEAFTGRYMELLQAGGSDWPHVLVGRLGIDLTDLSFWEQGLGEIENLIAQAEVLSRQAAPTG
jgi:oligoendopeptidase F